VRRLLRAGIPVMVEPFVKGNVCLGRREKRIEPRHTSRDTKAHQHWIITGENPIRYGPRIAHFLLLHLLTKTLHNSFGSNIIGEQDHEWKDRQE